MRLSSLAHAGQNSPAVRFPFFASAGSDAAALWLQCAPLSMADFRELRFRNLIAGNSSLDNIDARRAAFNTGFAGRIAQAIVSAEVSHG
ncbi:MULTISPECIES: hypothetical protein [Paraburkholderia]|uniref:hypothetical protein n=1 Tax=Paraburkholderia TaxID=1822464 RepID=UPI003218B558